jgi:hypothetical protein
MLKTCKGDEIIAYAPDAKTPWSRLHSGKETHGAELDRIVLQPLLPATLNAIYAAARQQGVKDYDTRGHLAWALSRSYLTINGQFVENRVLPQ